MHEGRHYKKLSPFVRLHQQWLEKFWEYYRKLLAYREAPTRPGRRRLEREFDRLFSEMTGYQELEERIEKTRAKRESLLKVLEYPMAPLHNFRREASLRNDSELAARARVRKRDVSFRLRTKEGLRAWDIFMSLAAAARKLGVSFSQYLKDRISGAHLMPALASLIQQRGIRHSRSLALAAA